MLSPLGEVSAYREIYIYDRSYREDKQIRHTFVWHLVKCTRPCGLFCVPRVVGWLAQSDRRRAQGDFFEQENELRVRREDFFERQIDLPGAPGSLRSPGSSRTMRSKLPLLGEK